MAILEIVAGGSDILKCAFAVQKTRLEEVTDVLTLDLTGIDKKGKEKILRSVEGQENLPEAVLVRSLEVLPLVVAYLPKIPIFADHCTPMEVGSTSPLRQCLYKVRRVYCYSQKGDEAVRRAGCGRITVISGPALPQEDDFPEHNERPVVGVLDTCSSSIQVLSRILKVAKIQNWQFDVVTPIQHSKVTQVENNLEAAEMADIIVAPSEDMDFGEPHEGAILAFMLRKPLITARSDAFNVMGYPATSYISAKKYQIGTYAAALGTYLHNRVKFDGWPGATSDPYALPTDMLSRMKLNG